jgi:site-specific recombinase XerD
MTREQAILLIRRVGETHTVNTANLLRIALRGVLKEAWKMGLMEGETYRRVSDLEAIKGFRLPKGRSLPPGEMRALFDHCDLATARGARNTAVLSLLYGAGLRRHEISNITLEDFHRAAGEVRVVRKGRKEQLVPLPDGADRALGHWVERYRGQQPGPLILQVKKNDELVWKGISPDAVYLIVKEVAEAANIESFTPHDMRRTFIGDLLDAGADISTVQQLAGHSSVVTTQKYDRRPHETRRRAAKTIHVPFKVGDPVR